MKHILTYIILITITISGCIKKPSFSNVPHIEFKDFVRYNNDSSRISFTFTDGDGDIGLRQSDTTAPYVGEYYYNIFLHIMYYDTTGIFHENFYLPTDSANPLNNNGRIPLIAPVGQDKSLEGEIHIKLSAPYPPALRSLQYRVYLLDRSLNKSNVIITPKLHP